MVDVVDCSLEWVRWWCNDIFFDVEVIGWQVYGDIVGLLWMVFNLMDNVVKWSLLGGYVGVRLSQFDVLYVELVVFDCGLGIFVQECCLVFEWFYWLVLVWVLLGLGFGLVIVKQVVFNYGGLLCIEDIDLGGQFFGMLIYVLFFGCWMLILQFFGVMVGVWSMDIENFWGLVNVILVEFQFMCVIQLCSYC